MVLKTADEMFIQGLTREGRTFRPSDWAERLAGVMSSFRPGGAQPGSHLNYSPWCIPTVIEGVKCVIVNRALRDYEPMAWDFVMNFARDNDLRITEAAPPVRQEKKAALGRAPRGAATLSASKRKNRPEAVLSFALLAAHPDQTAWALRLTG